MNRVAFSICNIDVYWYGIIAGLGIVLGVLTASLLAKKRNKFSYEELLDVVIVSLPFGIIGARLYYVLFRWDYYRSRNLGEIIMIRDGGLAFHGGLIMAVLVGAIYCKRKELPFGHIMDCSGPALLIGQGLGRWGNFFNQEAHGGEVSKAYISHFPSFIQKGMFINGAYYHPTFLYEFLWNMMIFILLLLLWNRYSERPGTIFCLYLIGYSFGRLWIEGLRTDSLMLGSLRIAQVVSIVGILTGLIFLIHINKPKENAG